MKYGAQTVPTALCVLIVEDSDDDTALLVRALRRGGEIAYERVDTAEAMSNALSRRKWDLIIADYSLPSFSGPAALALAMEHAVDVPFILVSGVASEEVAVQAMKAGADDYISKGNFVRLLPAIERECRKAEERRQAKLVEQELRRREAHLAHALQLARVGTWHVDLVTGAAVWSDEVCRIAGLETLRAAPAFEELLNRLYPKDRALLIELLRNPATKQFSQDLQVMRADGLTQFVNMRGDIIRDGHSIPLEAAGTIRDISERKAVEAEVEQVQSQLKLQNLRLVSLTEQAHAFVDDVSHEFRTPLAVIKEFGAIMNDGLAGPITAEQGEYLGIIDSAVVDLNQMVEDFLDSSKLRAGLLRVDRRCQTIESIFARIRPGLQSKAANRSITIEECIDPGLPLVYSDEEKVRRVIMNLATNAIKFSPKGTRVGLWARHAPEGGVEIGVTDEGRGLAAGDLEQLFERFRQVPDSDAPTVKGFGLGLNIARQLVWLNLGRMNVVSELGRGSTFSFTLPADDPRMIVERFFLRLAERDNGAQGVALISITPEDPSESRDALLRFLAATTRPTDVVLEMSSSAGNVLILGPTESPGGWTSRLWLARERAIASSGEAKLGRISVSILATFVCPADAPAATACALEYLTPESACV